MSLAKDPQLPQELPHSALSDAKTIVSRLQDGTLSCDDLGDHDYHIVIKAMDSTSRLMVFPQSPTKSYVAKLLGITTNKVTRILEALRLSYGHVDPTSPLDRPIFQQTPSIIHQVWERVMLMAEQSGDYKTMWSVTHQATTLGQSLGYITRVPDRVEVTGTGILGLMATSESARREIEGYSDWLIQQSRQNDTPPDPSANALRTDCPLSSKVLGTETDGTGE
jgi:hypothetical protein